MIRAVIFDWARTLYDPDHGTAYPEAREVVRSLSEKYRLAIVALASDGDLERRYRLLRETYLEQYFESVMFHQSDKDGLYLKTLSSLALKPEQVAIVDDRVLRGVCWGNRHGAMTVWLRRGKFSDQVPNELTGTPSHVVTDLTQLLTFL